MSFWNQPTPCIMAVRLAMMVSFPLLLAAFPAAAKAVDDPWDVEPVEIQATLLFVPFTNEGQVTEEGDSIAGALAAQWTQSLPRSVAVLPDRFVHEFINEQHQELLRFPFPLTAEILGKLRRYTNPTHTLHGSWAEDGGEWRLEVILEEGGDVHATTLTVPPGHDIVAASQITRWMLEVGGLELTDAERGHLRRPYYGGLFRSSSDPTLEAMREDPADHPGWERFSAREGMEDLHRFERISRALATGMREVALLHVLDTPPPPEATVAAHRSYFELEDEGTGMRDYPAFLRRVLAHYPGLYEFGWRMTRPWSFRGLEAPELELLGAGIVRWHDNNPTSPFLQAMVGRFHVEWAWGRRGSGYIHTVGPGELADFRRHIETARLWLESSQVEGGFHPPHAADLIQVYGAQGNMDRAIRLTERVAEEHPLHVESHRQVLHFLLPRWHGSIEEGIEYIDSVLARDPSAPRLGRVAPPFHVWEARGQESGNVNDVMANYYRRYPRAEEQMEESFRRLFSSRSAPEDALFGLYYRIAAGLGDGGTRAARHHRNLHKADWAVVPLNHRPRATFQVINAYVEYGYWAELLEIIDIAEEMDEHKRPTATRSWELVFQHGHWCDVYRALAHAQLGNRARAREYLEGAEPAAFTRPFLYFARLSLWDDPDGLAEELRERMDEDPNRFVEMKILATLLARQRQREEARRLWDRASEVPHAQIWQSLERQFNGLMSAP